MSYLPQYGNPVFSSVINTEPARYVSSTPTYSTAPTYSTPLTSYTTTAPVTYTNAPVTYTNAPVSYTTTAPVSYTTTAPVSYTTTTAPTYRTTTTAPSTTTVYNNNERVKLVRDDDKVKVFQHVVRLREYSTLGGAQTTASTPLD